MLRRWAGVIVVCVCAGILFQECGGSGNSPKEAVDSVITGGVDYELLQRTAMAFVPRIGKPGGAIVLSTFSDPKSFNPIISTEMTTAEFTSYIYEGLVRSNGVTLLPEPNLAASWDISSDGLQWTFHIRPGVRWSDGHPFSAYDVEFTFNKLIYNMAITPNPPRDIFLIGGKRIGITVLDSGTIRFELPFPYAPFLRAMTQEILPKHRCAQLVKKGKFSTALNVKTPPDQMIGTGPFLLKSYLSSQKVVFKRNPDYWKTDSAGARLPYLDSVVYTIVADHAAELLQFKRGEVDFLSANGEDFPGLKKDEATSNYTVYRLGPATGGNFLVFNQNRDRDPKTGRLYVDSVRLSWFTNVNFRRAIAHALDKRKMINFVMNGLGYPQWSPMTPSEGYFFNSDVPTYPYDIGKAKKILAEAGFADRNGDNILEDGGGHAVEFSFVTNSGNMVRGKIAEIIRKELEAIGCRVHLKMIEFDSLIEKIENPPYEWDVMLLGLSGSVEPHFGGNVWRSSDTLHMWYPHQKRPATPWEAAIDSLFELGVKEIDNGKRKTIYNEWQRIAAEQLPMIYTVLPERILCIANKFGNLNPTLDGGLLHNLEYLYVK